MYEMPEAHGSVKSLSIAVLVCESKGPYGEHLKLLFDNLLSSCSQVCNDVPYAEATGNGDPSHVQVRTVTLNPYYFDAYNQIYPEKNDWDAFAESEGLHGMILKATHDAAWQTLDDFVGVIVSGSESAAYDTDEWIIRLQDTIRHLFLKRKPLVGFCFGHQLIAHALGGKVVKSPLGQNVGIHKGTINAPYRQFLAPYFHQSATMNGNTELDHTKLKVSLVYCHGDIVTSCPSQFEVALKDGVIKKEKLRCASLFSIREAYHAGILIAGQEGFPFVFTLQGHPEYSTESGRRSYKFLLQLKLEQGRIDKKRYEEVHRQFNDQTDHLTIGRMLIDLFLHQELCIPVADLAESTAAAASVEV